MKIKGKIAVWFWFILIGANALILYELLFDLDNVLVLLISLAAFNIIFLPIVIRNYVYIDADTVHLYFGFCKDSIQISLIEEIQKTHCPISSSAASLDRLTIKGGRQVMLVSLQNKEKLIEELKKRNSNIKVS